MANSMTYGEIGYRAYLSEARGNRQIEVFAWKDLNLREKAAWEVAALSIIEACPEATNG